MCERLASDASEELPVPPPEPSYSLLRTFEDAFGLAHLQHAGDPTVPNMAPSSPLTTRTGTKTCSSQQSDEGWVHRPHAVGPGRVDLICSKSRTQVCRRRASWIDDTTRAHSTPSRDRRGQQLG